MRPDTRTWAMRGPQRDRSRTRAARVAARAKRQRRQLVRHRLDLQPLQAQHPYHP